MDSRTEEVTVALGTCKYQSVFFMQIYKLAKFVIDPAKRRGEP